MEVFGSLRTWGSEIPVQSFLQSFKVGRFYFTFVSGPDTQGLSLGWNFEMLSQSKVSWPCPPRAWRTSVPPRTPTRCLYAAFFTGAGSQNQPRWPLTETAAPIHSDDRVAVIAAGVVSPRERTRGVDGRKAGVGWPPHLPSLFSFQPNWGQDGDKVKVKVKIRVRIQG